MRDPIPREQRPSKKWCRDKYHHLQLRIDTIPGHLLAQFCDPGWVALDPGLSLLKPDPVADLYGQAYALDGLGRGQPAAAGGTCQDDTQDNEVERLQAPFGAEELADVLQPGGETILPTVRGSIISTSRGDAGKGGQTKQVAHVVVEVAQDLAALGLEAGHCLLGHGVQQAGAVVQAAEYLVQRPDGAGTGVLDHLVDQLHDEGGQTRRQDGAPGQRRGKQCRRSMEALDSGQHACTQGD